ncbi:CIC11C00000002938 [Sungouiella intermedia]|uniref:CIC11C00000002938 n=1 Tax=Sungouiella intermedia TaxID=45354 RepID=A0A1L0D9T2_9ASCO|nr:CIC11C00000002938 [[Candida] intermedia]
MRALVLALLTQAGFCFVTLPIKYVAREQSIGVYEPQTSKFLKTISYERELVLEAEVGPQKTNTEFLVDFWGYSNTLTSQNECGKSCTSDHMGQSLNLGDVQVEDVPFTTLSLQNHLRFGPSEARRHEPLMVEKMNIVQLLKYQKKIKRALASFLFPKDDLSVGELVLGGIDHSKHRGALRKVPFSKPEEHLGSDKGNMIVVALDEILLNGKQLAKGGYDMMLSTSQISRLPQKFVTAIARHFGGVYDETVNSFYFGSSIVDTDETLTFSINGANIIVPVRELVTQNGQERYLLSITHDVNENVGILGMDILKHAYLVIDYDNSEIGLATAFRPLQEPLEVQELAYCDPSTSDTGHNDSVLKGYSLVNHCIEEDEVITAEDDQSVEVIAVGVTECSD